MARTKAPAKPGAGYSGTPLAQKLGIKEGHRLFLIHVPVFVVFERGDRAADAAHAFAQRRIG